MMWNDREDVQEAQSAMPIFALNGHPLKLVYQCPGLKPAQARLHVLTVLDKL